MRICPDGQATFSGSVVALGMFDGLHLGHQVLLKRAKALARRKNVPLVVSTFTTHPMQMIQPESCPPMLTTLHERSERMEELGVDILCAQPFDRHVMNTPPEEFIARLCRQFHPCFIVAGYNHTFGRNGEGDAALLTALGKVFGFAAEVVPKITLDGSEVSSSAVRELLAQGHVGHARRMLGKPYQRRAVAVGGKEGRWVIKMLADGKQDVPPGRYRVLVDCAGGSFVATLNLQSTGQGMVSFPRSLFVEPEVLLRFYHRKA